MVVILFHQCIEADTDAQDVVVLCDLARVHELEASRDDVSQHVDKLWVKVLLFPVNHLDVICGTFTLCSLECWARVRATCSTSNIQVRIRRWDCSYSYSKEVPVYSLCVVCELIFACDWCIISSYAVNVRPADFWERSLVCSTCVRTSNDEKTMTVILYWFSICVSTWTLTVMWSL